MSHPTNVADRRATAAQLSRDGLSLRKIAAKLGVSKDTVRRDLAAPVASAAAKDRATVRAKIAQEVTTAGAALEQLRAAVEEAAAARPGYVLVSDEVATEWVTQLRAAAAIVTSLADDFGTYYPHTQEEKMET